MLSITILAVFCISLFSELDLSDKFVVFGSYRNGIKISDTAIFYPTSEFFAIITFFIDRSA
jgi:hypothetical protein